MDFDLVTSGIINDANLSNQSQSPDNSGSNNSNSGSRKGSPAPPKPPKPSFHLTRRLSSNFPLVKSAESQLPFSDPTSVARFDSLIDQFPKPPSTTEVTKSSAKPTNTNTSSSASSGSSWSSLKGLAERFNLFGGKAV